MRRTCSTGAAGRDAEHARGRAVGRHRAHALGGAHDGDAELGLVEVVDRARPFAQALFGQATKQHGGQREAVVDHRAALQREAVLDQDGRVAGAASRAPGGLVVEPAALERQQLHLPAHRARRRCARRGRTGTRSDRSCGWRRRCRGPGGARGCARPPVRPRHGAACRSRRRAPRPARPRWAARCRAGSGPTRWPPAARAWPGGTAAHRASSGGRRSKGGGGLMRPMLSAPAVIQVIQ